MKFIIVYKFWLINLLKSTRQGINAGVKEDLREQEQAVVERLLRRGLLAEQRLVDLRRQYQVDHNVAQAIRDRLNKELKA